jgi:hypothetical protein
MIPKSAATRAKFLKQRYKVTEAEIPFWYAYLRDTIYNEGCDFVIDSRKIEIWIRGFKSKDYPRITAYFDPPAETKLKSINRIYHRAKVADSNFPVVMWEGFALAKGAINRVDVYAQHAFYYPYDIDHLEELLDDLFPYLMAAKPQPASVQTPIDLDPPKRGV